MANSCRARFVLSVADAVISLPCLLVVAVVVRTMYLAAGILRLYLGAGISSSEIV